MRFRRLLLSIATLMTMHAHAQQAGFSDADAAKVDSVVAKMLRDKQAPGAVVAIVKDGAVVYRKAHGVADLRTQRPMSLQDRFEIGSLTKQMTAAAVLQLAQAGKLSLDDTVGKYLPDYPAAAAVTIRQLLWQVSGLPDFAGTPAFAANASSHPTDFKSLLDTVRALPLEFQPGERWRYSNTNYVLLGRIVELTGGASFDTYLAHHVLAKAGMATAVTLDQTAGKATGYTTDHKQVIPAAVFQNSWIGAAGNLVACIDDLIAWDRALWRQHLLPDEALAAMRTPPMLNDGSPGGYGYGLFIDHQDGRDRVWHGGGTLGFSSSNMIYPQEQLWLIALVNHEDLSATVMTAAIYDALHGIAPDGRPAVGEQPDITAKARLWLQRVKQGELPAAEVAPDLLRTLEAHQRRRYKWLQTKVDVYGRPEAVVYAGSTARDGAALHRYRLRFGAQWLRFEIGLLPDGRLADLDIAAE